MFTLDWDIIKDFETDEIPVAMTKVIIELTNLMHEKVLENLSGKILNKISGQLYNSIHQTVEVTEDSIVGEVFVDPASPKAWALEKGGGQGTYPIVAKNVPLLQFFWEREQKFFKGFKVNHPRSKEFGYLHKALEEVKPLVEERMIEEIQAVLDRQTK